MPEVAWIPAWHERDQTIQVGTGGEYYFWGEVPEAPRAAQALVFYNAEWNAPAMVAASGFIVGIRHPVLGALRKVETIGLDYSFVLADGTEVEVNANEEPGKVHEREGKPVPAVDDWTLVVEFRSLSELKPAR